MQARNFVKYIATAEREKIIGDYNAIKFFSIMSDGSTDSAVIEEEIIYVR